MNHNNIVIGIISATIIYLCLIIYKTYRVTNKQKILLLQSQLDKELINKLLTILCNTQDSSDVIDLATELLKGYYQFYSTAVYDTEKQAILCGSNNLSLIDYIHNNQKRIIEDLLLSRNAHYENKGQDVYVFKLTDEIISKYLLILTKNHEGKLSSEDFNFISRIITKILGLALR